MPPAWAAAQAWHVDRVSGQAWVGAADGQRSELAAGMELAPGATLSTGERSRVMLVRGAETMVVGPRSVIAVSEHPTEGLTTTVLEKAGTVQFDVEKRNVHYFSVETPMLAAVVKGTRFTVSVGRTRGGVAVSRGTVEVSALATGQVSNVTAGQHAQVSSRGMAVGGAGRPSISIGTPRSPVVSSLTVAAPTFAAPQFSEAELAAVATVAAPAVAATATATTNAAQSADHTSNAAASAAAAAPSAQLSAPVAAPAAASAANLGGGLVAAVAGALSSHPSGTSPAGATTASTPGTKDRHDDAGTQAKGVPGDVRTGSTQTLNAALPSTGLLGLGSGQIRGSANNGNGNSGKGGGTGSSSLGGGVTGSGRSVGGSGRGKS